MIIGEKPTPMQILGMEPETIDKEYLLDLNGHSYKHIPEIDFDKVDPQKNKEVEIKYYANKYFDLRNIWRLASVWYKNQPVMIILNAGKEGDDFFERWVVDVEQYLLMVNYLKSLYYRRIIKTNEPYADRIDWNDTVHNLVEFKGHSLKSIKKEQQNDRQKLS